MVVEEDKKGAKYGPFVSKTITQMGVLVFHLHYCLALALTVT